VRGSICIDCVADGEPFHCATEGIPLALRVAEEFGYSIGKGVSERELKALYRIWETATCMCGTFWLICKCIPQMRVSVLGVGACES
jgi:hypothetical protein